MEFDLFTVDIDLTTIVIKKTEARAKFKLKNHYGY